MGMTRKILQESELLRNLTLLLGGLSYLPHCRAMTTLFAGAKVRAFCDDRRVRRRLPASELHAEGVKLRSIAERALEQDSTINREIRSTDLKGNFGNGVPTKDIGVVVAGGKSRQGFVRFCTIEVHQFQV